MPTPSDLESSTANNCQLTRRELTTQKIAQTPYHYIYLPRSPVFHCRDCKLVLNSKEFFGSIQYRTAAKKRRPCKVCNPTLEHFTAQETAPSEGSSKQDSKKAQQVQNPNEVIQVRLLGNHFVSIRRNLLVGCCHNRLHPGKLTQKLMEEHSRQHKFEQRSFFIKADTLKKDVVEGQVLELQQLKQHHAAQRSTKAQIQMGTAFFTIQY